LHKGESHMISPVGLPSSLACPVDEVGTVHGADQLLAGLGAPIADSVPCADGALTLTAPHPIGARPTWLCCTETGPAEKKWQSYPEDPTRRPSSSRLSQTAQEGL
jgi:hypothetical protein